MKRLIDRLTKRFAAAVAKEIGIQVFEIAKLDLKPGDRIILRTKKVLSEKAYENIQASAEQIFPGHQVIVLEEGLGIEIV